MPLTLGYSSSYGVLADAYHVLTDFFVTSGSANDTIVSGSLWVNKSAFDNNKTPIIKYTFDFNSLKAIFLNVSSSNNSSNIAVVSLSTPIAIKLDFFM